MIKTILVYATALLVILTAARATSPTSAAPARSDYLAYNWYVNIDPVRCQSAVIGGPIAHAITTQTRLQVLIYPVTSGQPEFAGAFGPFGPSTGTVTIHVTLPTPMYQWGVLVLTDDSPPWRIIDGTFNCPFVPLKE